ncbi:interleukin-15 [Tiliqua scincoides]|uniref:interleukin-15 n=1 Tax=Tiliqua scincoides TaxID=71010 RepID=UPI0034634EDD
MDNYFRSSLINELTLTFFILCSFLLQVQANNNIYWDAVMKDLERIETTFGKSSQVNVFLYTAENYIDACKLSAMRCFLLEMDVILYESSLDGDKSFFTSVSHVRQNINASLESANKDKVKETPACRQCESFEEKNFTQFIQGLKHAVQRFHRSSQRWRP